MATEATFEDVPSAEELRRLVSATTDKESDPRRIRARISDAVSRAAQEGLLSASVRINPSSRAAFLGVAKSVSKETRILYHMRDHVCGFTWRPDSRASALKAVREAVQKFLSPSRVRPEFGADIVHIEYNRYDANPYEADISQFELTYAKDIVEEETPGIVVAVDMLWVQKA